VNPHINISLVELVWADIMSDFEVTGRAIT
jgi:hypothetical protein